MKIQSLKFTVIYLIYFGISNTLLAFSPNVINQKVDLERLGRLLKDDSEQFYKEASKITGNEIKDKNTAREFFILKSTYFFNLGKFDSMYYSLLDAKSLANNSKSEEIIHIFLQLATAHYYLSNFDSLAYYQQQVSDLIDSKSSHYPQHLLLEGLKFDLSANYNKAIEVILEAIKLYEYQRDENRLAVAYNNLAINYKNIGRTDLQLEYLLKALEINKKLGVPNNLAMNYINLGIYYKNIDDYEKSIYYLEFAYENIIKINSVILLAQNLTTRANIHQNLKEYDTAERLFLECDSICEKNQIHYGKMIAVLNLGNIYREKRMYQEAESKLNKAWELAKSLGAKREEALTLERLFWLSRDRKDFETALDFQTRFHTLNDSIINEKVKIEANELRELYEVEKKENEIISLTIQKLQQRYVIFTLGVVILILALIAQWFKNKHTLSQLKLMDSEILNKLRLETLEIREKDLMQQTMEKVVLQEHLDTLIEKIEKNNNDEIVHNVRAIKKKQNPWDGMIEKFKLLHPQFMDQLTKEFPTLTRSELELCSLIKMNLTTKEIASILRITSDSVFTKKYRILKKLNLEKNTDLTTWIHSFSINVREML
ncbi:regulatory protein, luxR family [Belliella buryatensis]|uniref:Regulatory protein, luxR family n=1 Tax=Belliella buryatensis TaxID=1500549 RepID=A0A239HAP5_9BACT|nr:tetratricopeptide repeat protein [Belliella buryatensis]SNS78221.1 regulatory protein, luxR family [Belliella buryatensis]